MNKFFKNENGFTGADVAVSIVLLSIFLAVIATVFLNIYLSYTASQRNTVAMTYASQIAELVDKLYFQDISEDTNSKLKQGISQIVTNYAYTPTYTVTEYEPEQTELPILVKIVNISISYKVGNNVKSVEIQKIKSKEVLITPNKPVIETGMVPVKFVVVDYVAGTGYWQITSENDSSWYSYDNKVWAAAMPMEEDVIQGGNHVTRNLLVEGNIEVTNNNKNQLVGKRVITENTAKYWVPKYAYKNSDIIFLYSTSDSKVNNLGNLEIIGDDYTISNLFEGNSGFWIEKSSINQNAAANTLNQSKYGMK